jgi:hypothetical protein
MLKELIIFRCGDIGLRVMLKLLKTGKFYLQEDS